MTRKWRDLTHHWEDWANMAIGACLVVSPSALGFADLEPAVMNAFILGSMIFGIALLALVQFVAWEEWLLGILGLWSIAAPWALGFANQPSALWAHLVTGGLVVGLAAIELWTEHLAHDAGAKHPA